MSGGCHRAATGNISIFAGCDGVRLELSPVLITFERALPVLTGMGRNILSHWRGRVGVDPEGGSPITWPPPTWYRCARRWSPPRRLAGIDLNTAYEAIRISSGNSFVHETEPGQVILNGW